MINIYIYLYVYVYECVLCVRVGNGEGINICPLFPSFFLFLSSLSFLASSCNAIVEDPNPNGYDEAPKYRSSTEHYKNYIKSLFDNVRVKLEVGLSLT